MRTQPIPERHEAAPVIIYDGGCSFCRHWIAWFDAHLASPVRPKPSTNATLAMHGVSRADADASVQWVAESDRASGARAVAAWFKTSSKLRWRILGRLISFRPVTPFAETAYGVIARNRHRLPSGVNRNL
jgi:predicted DCC family thiol-disulfide oxidoreductase YuxK